ncbi:MAG: glycerate-2-kinase family protein, partial [Chloroflexi bacterium]|nr:glycerate-2-kinase family protein [Chloroflexota bacterium]
MIPAESFWTLRQRFDKLNAAAQGSASSMHNTLEGESITRILAAAIAAVEPGAAVQRAVQRDGNKLTISGRTYNLSAFRRVCLLGIGKASLAMTEAMADILGGRLSGGLVVAKHAGEKQKAKNKIEMLEGDHPIPGERSLLAGGKVVEFVSALGPDALLFCLLSGGGSALVTAPVDGVTLADMQALTSALLACGARVDEINTLRRRLDWVKGGGVAKLANGATIISLILSDVVGNPLEAIASGPTAPDPSTRQDVLSILEKYGLEGQIPLTINHALHSSETPKPGDPLFERVQNIIIGSNLTAAQAALKQAEVEGFHPYLLRTDLQGEARDVSFELATFLRQARQTSDPVPR